MKNILLLLSFLAIFSCKKETPVQNNAENNDTVSTVVNEIEGLEDNTLKFDASKTALKWTAYKQPEKIAVHGSFDSIVVQNTKESVIPEEILEGATFFITTSSMTTGDVSRDAKILSLFFNNLDSPNISGEFGKFEDQNVPVKIKMNNVEVTKNFKYTFENNKIVITGIVDVLSDFKAQKGFDFLHEACAELHLNKTWTDISIEIISDLTK